MKNFLKQICFGALLFLLAACAGGIKDSQKKDNHGKLEPGRVEILFLGHDRELHNSEKFAGMVAMPLFQEGINLSYTEDPEDLSIENLSKYDGLMIYANHDNITTEQEAAIKTFVEGGKGLIPIHSASFMFRNSDWYVEAVGAQFKSHEYGAFTAPIVNPEHPVMQGISEFETKDETYVHDKINPDMTVLMERVEGDHREPWTWARKQGEGKVFYTAYGHDENTWAQPEFHKLLANGVLWAVNDKAREELAKLDIPTPEFEDADIPNYERRDPAPKFQRALSPAESQRLTKVPVDFELQLFAAEPDIINPIAMAWDEKGRLFVIETVDYPNEVRTDSGEGNDRIKILEDTDGDGKADKVTVFADGLNIPTSLAFANGGLIVSMAPHFLFLKDTDGDDKADVREKIITGWGKRDTHAGPSNLKYGLDNKVWGVLGYSGFDGTVSGKKMSFGQGVYKFDPDGENLEFLARTSNNTWGLGFSEEFDVFISTANGLHSAYLAMPNESMKRVIAGGAGSPVYRVDSHYDMPHVTPYLRQVDYHGGYTAAAGHNLYTARNYPKSYWNSVAFVGEPTGRVLHQVILEEKGAGYTEENGFNLLASADEWFSPVHAEVGPDGAVWVADWYNFIIQHNPTPRGFENGEGNAYINPLRDRGHGRIYRVVYKDAKPVAPMQLSKNDAEGLVAALKNDNMFWRLTAQRIIVESKIESVIPDLYALINDKNVDEIGLNSPAVHALWTLHGLGALDGSNRQALFVVEKALSHPAAGVRQNAIKVLPANERSLKAIIGADVINDADMKTRLAAALAISKMPSSRRVGEVIYGASLNEKNTRDEYLPQALFAAALAHEQDFRAAAPERANLQKADSLLSLSERLMKSMSQESYKLDRRSPIAFPPDVTEKEIIIRTSVERSDDEDMSGVIVEQGDNNNGYSLYILDGKLHWLVKQDGKTYEAISKTVVPKEKFNLIARLSKGGSMSVDVDGETVAEAKAPSLFSKALISGDVRVGRSDNENKIGEYPDRFWFRGDLDRDGVLELKKASESTVEAAVEAPVDKTPVKKSTPAPKTNLDSEAVTINMKVVEHEMKFSKESFKVKAGQKVSIVFENPDFMQHNLVIAIPGSFEKVGAAADVLARDPNGAEQEYVPKMPEVIAATKLVNPEGKVTLTFTVPDKPGEYPYICTVPGHWRLMNGIMVVE
ncbi:ThuA domain-containing protein [Salegentibacter sp. F188]|uniref:ThuA domain-containing protein n=1 Tax=Autumnicola patrickiae TaxID=3075591 RepID=A0ABU3E2W8_9FLAO|nr:PVC-type heme-binding CxxCH protein [Salegentibacter sp. F188]MDT0689592.1 ThuA domain-containing protein [Salegentibacter sp. F188]